MPLHEQKDWINVTKMLVNQNCVKNTKLKFKINCTLSKEMRLFMTS